MHEFSLGVMPTLRPTEIPEKVNEAQLNFAKQWEENAADHIAKYSNISSPNEDFGRTLVGSNVAVHKCLRNLADARDGTSTK